MKYYSELTEKLYETEKDLTKAECDFIAAEEKAKEEEKHKTSRKKELAKAVEDADAKLETAYKLLDEAKEKYKEILHKANQEAAAVLKEASQTVKDAERSRMKAVRNFNDEFGPFKVSYTGEKAQREFDRAVKYFDNMFTNLFRF